MTAEEQRLQQEIDRTAYWSCWGPYLSERQWGTVREDYSADGSAWDYFPHDHARSRAYRWGEDGIAGLSDNHQRLCFAITLWNGEDPILKERMFGLNSTEGNHGEDVKEYYFYLDSTPTHSYMKCLYKYPQQAFPYAQLVTENQKRDYTDPEYELLDTGIFEGDRQFLQVIKDDNIYSGKQKCRHKICGWVIRKLYPPYRRVPGFFLHFPMFLVFVPLYRGSWVTYGPPELSEPVAGETVHSHPSSPLQTQFGSMFASVRSR